MKFKLFILFVVFLSATMLFSNAMAIPIITFSMPRSFDVYQNEISNFIITVNNAGDEDLHNVVVHIIGIPEDSYSISPNSVDILREDESSYFSVHVNSENLNPETYTLTVIMESDETSETVNMFLNVKEYVRQIGQRIEEQEEFEQEKKPALESTKNILIGVMIVSGTILIATSASFIAKYRYLRRKE